MPITSLKIFTKSAFAAFIGFSTIVVSIVPADAKLPYPISRAAEEQGKHWVSICRRAPRPGKCCEAMHKDQIKRCESSESTEQQTCVDDAWMSLAYCQSEIPRGISSPPSVGENPLKVAPSSPIFRKPKLVSPSGQPLAPVAPKSVAPKSVAPSGQPLAPVQ